MRSPSTAIAAGHALPILQRWPRNLLTPICSRCSLWYIAPGWNVGWSGETMLYDHNQDAVACVTPRPGRLAIFDGTILHAGRPPNRICYAPRYTLAFKLAPPPP